MELCGTILTSFLPGIRSLRGALATGSFITGMGEQVSVHRHQLEAKVKIAGSPKCRVLIYTPPDDEFNENTGVLVHFVSSMPHPLAPLKLNDPCPNLGHLVAYDSLSRRWRHNLDRQHGGGWSM